MREIFVAAQLKVQAGQLRHETLDGREYLVVPAVAVVEGVLNGNLVHREEIAAYVEAWNGRPFVIRHPKRNGEYISANSPEVLAESGAGFLFNSRMDNDRLRCEIWMDVAKAKALGGSAVEVLRRFEANEPTELSTGYFCDLEPTSGYFKGQFYRGVQRNLRPDHIAALPDETGACSWNDGCGAPRVNKAHLVTNQQHDGVMLAFYLRNEDAQALALNDVPAGVEALPASELHVTLAYGGKVEEQYTTMAELLDLAANFARYEVVVAAKVIGGGKFLNVDTDQDAHFVIVQSDQLYQFRERLCEWLGYEIPVERRYTYLPHITLAYGPVGVDVPLSIVERDLIFESLAVSWGDTTIVFPLQGQIREIAEMATNEQDKAKVTPKKIEEEGAGQTKTQPPTTNTTNEPAVNATPSGQAHVETPTIPAEVMELAGLVKELGGVNGVKEALQSIQVNARRMRDDLVGRLVGNKQCAFTQEQLQAMPLEHLEALERSLRPADYSGRSGLAANAFTDDGNWEEYKTPETPAAKQ
jgi:2'-5' RNA ligase